MREVLIELNKDAGINGSMVITPDGIMVSAALCAGFEEDSMAAFAASHILSLRRSLVALKTRGEWKSCSLQASAGKVTFLDMQNSFLVLVTSPDSEVDCNSAPIQNAIYKIKNRRIA